MRVEFRTTEGGASVCHPGTGLEVGRQWLPSLWLRSRTKWQEEDAGPGLHNAFHIHHFHVLVLLVIALISFALIIKLLIFRLLVCWILQIAQFLIWLSSKLQLMLRRLSLLTDWLTEGQSAFVTCALPYSWLQSVASIAFQQRPWQWWWISSTRVKPKGWRKVLEADPNWIHVQMCPQTPFLRKKLVSTGLADKWSPFHMHHMSSQ